MPFQDMYTAETEAISAVTQYDISKSYKETKFGSVNDLS